MFAAMAVSTKLLIIFEIIIIITIIQCGGSSFDVHVDSKGPYSIYLNNLRWLTSGDTAFNSDGQTFSVSDGTLTLTTTTTDRGSDRYGPWSSTSFIYQAGQTSINATIKVYAEPNFSAAVFTQTYLDTASNTSANNTNGVISKFPSFKLQDPDNVSLGYLSYGGDLVGYSRMSIGRLLNTTSFVTGMTGGPLVIFDNSSNALVISPLSQFMAASGSIDLEKQLEWGIMGLVDDVPKGYSVSFIVYYSNQGINQAVRSWGNFLTTLYQKSKAPRDNDPTVQYLGYWTNNGGFYYYNTEKGKNYEATILDVVDYIQNISIPFKYLQFDSWFYPKGKHNGVRTWEPQSSIFPNGFQYIYNKTKLPFGCHNRYWDNDTTYASYNGGPYNFIPDPSSGFAVPDDYKLWQDLFNTTRTWGKFILYEQDWLNRETNANAILHTELFLGQRWLMQMGQAAETFGITIQYCLSHSRHILQALEIPAVTQARVSADYLSTPRQWNIGITSLFADAVNIAPFKDTFWTTEHQPGNPYNKTEPAPELQTLISTLSTGPVGPGDGIGFINKTLLMRSCDASGLILKPDVAATAVDDQIKRAAFGSSFIGPVGDVYSTYSIISGYFFGIVLAANLTNDYYIRPSSAWPNVQFESSLAFFSSDPDTLVKFSNSEPVRLTAACTVVDFCLIYTSPVITLESGDIFSILGELNKWVPLSRKRFRSIETASADVHINLVVQAKETVTVSYYDVNRKLVKSVTCDNSKNPTPAEASVISLAKGTCAVA